jgi:hypothetical protein
MDCCSERRVAAGRVDQGRDGVQQPERVGRGRAETIELVQRHQRRHQVRREQTISGVQLRSKATNKSASE